ncbi:hypothetical protein KGY63_05370 [Candidatus Bipolaricaulota bacterium]|nr:hypothetical protein [Candidatus Bipolaricaulota bacterium]
MEYDGGSRRIKPEFVSKLNLGVGTALLLYRPKMPIFFMIIVLYIENECNDRGV